MPCLRLRPGWRKGWSGDLEARGGRGVPADAGGLRRLLVALEGELFEEILGHPGLQPSLKAGYLAQVGQAVTHLLEEHHLLLQEAALQELAELDISPRTTQGMQIQKRLVQALLQGHGVLHGVHAGIPLLWGQHLSTLNQGAITPGLSHLQEKLGALLLLLSQHPEEAAHTIHSRSTAFKVNAPGGVGG